MRMYICLCTCLVTLSIVTGVLCEAPVSDMPIQTQPSTDLETKVKDLEISIKRLKEHQLSTDLETKVKDLEISLKRFKESQEFYILFDNYRVGLVGLVLVFASLLAVVVNAFIFMRGWIYIKGVRKLVSQSASACDLINQRREQIEQLHENTKLKVFGLLEQLTTRFGRIAELRKDQLLALDEMVGAPHTFSELEVFLRDFIKKDVEVFERYDYQMALFHPDENVARQSVLFFRKRGALTDIDSLEQAKQLFSSAELIRLTEATIRQIRTSCLSHLVSQSS